MGDFKEESYLREKARSLQAGLLSRFEEYVEEFPRGQSSNLIETIRFFLAQVEADIAGCSDPKLLRWFCSLIDELSEVLEWLDHAHTAQTPRAYVDVLGEISRQLHDGAEILVTPTVESNYRIIDEIPRLARLTNALSEARQKAVIARFPEALYHVHFPRIERENILNHALFGHEFGHPVADEFLDDYELELRYQEHLNEAQAEIEKDSEVAQDLADADETTKTELLNDIQSKLSDIHRRALVELMSDAVAVHLFGPSAIFASMDLLIREALDEMPEHDEYYPPTRYRWRLTFEILQREGYIDALRSLRLTAEQQFIKDALNSTLDFLQHVVADTRDRDALASDIYTRAAYAWLERTLPDALKHADARATCAKYNPALITSEVPPLVERLQAGVPPSEVGTWPDVKPVDWRSTIVAGWVFALSQTLDSNLEWTDKREALRTTNRLAVKGVEYIFLQRELREYKQKAAKKKKKL
jgi:uncharacterized protein YbaR (Trm112 family)